MPRPTIQSLFKNTLLLSGTPDWRQRELSMFNFKNVCSCNPKTAMDNKWICKPTLNVVDCEKLYWPDAVRAVLENENAVYEHSEKIFKPVILVNCGSIDDVVNLRSEEWFSSRMGKEFHFVSIHSDKNLEVDGEKFVATAEVDGKEVSSGEAYKVIEGIKTDDTGYFHDKLPVIVAQVQMIGEGINVKAFNAVLTASNSDKTAMQQIGRALRNDFVRKTVKVPKTVKVSVEKQKEGFWNRLFNRTETVEEERTEYIEEERVYTKVDDGHASVYMINDNEDSIVELLANLCTGHDLTDDCFAWGRKIDLDGGSNTEVIDETDCAKRQKAQWEDINSIDPEIKTIMGDVRKYLANVAMQSFLAGDDNDGNGKPDIEELDELLSGKSDKVRVWTKNKNRLKIEEVCEKMFDLLRTAMEQRYVRKLWKVDRKATMAMVFQDSDVAEFFETHMNKNYRKYLDNL